MKKHNRASRIVLIGLVGLFGVSSLQAYAGSIVINLPPKPKPQPQPKSNGPDLKKPQ
ncbi:MAG: hypothetical protein RJB13_987 [Pseudomonadota bacterium]